MGLYEALKDLAKVIQRMDNIEVTQKLMDVQMQAGELIEEAHVLRDKVRQLETRSQIEQSLVFEDDVYYRRLSKGGEDGPFCSKCWDVTKALVRLHTRENWWFCPNCNTTVQFRR